MALNIWPVPRCQLCGAGEVLPLAERGVTGGVCGKCAKAFAFSHWCSVKARHRPYKAIPQFDCCPGTDCDGYCETEYVRELNDFIWDHNAVLEGEYLRANEPTEWDFALWLTRKLQKGAARILRRAA